MILLTFSFFFLVLTKRVFSNQDWNIIVVVHGDRTNETFDTYFFFILINANETEW